MVHVVMSECAFCSWQLLPSHVIVREEQLSVVWVYSECVYVEAESKFIGPLPGQMAVMRLPRVQHCSMCTSLYPDGLTLAVLGVRTGSG